MGGGRQPRASDPQLGHPEGSDREHHRRHLGGCTDARQRLFALNVFTAHTRTSSPPPGFREQLRGDEGGRQRVVPGREARPVSVFLLLAMRRVVRVNPDPTLFCVVPDPAWWSWLQPGTPQTLPAWRTSAWSPCRRAEPPSLTSSQWKLPSTAPPSRSVLTLTLTLTGLRVCKHTMLS